MIASADLDSLLVAAKLSDETIEEMFVRTESWKHDFKVRYNPSDAHDKVEVVKDIVAFSNTAGGYLIVGVDRSRKVVGLTTSEIAALDEAVIRSQVQSYLGGAIDLFVSTVAREGKDCVIITTLRSGRSPLVFQKDGNYLVNGKTREVFRAGDVFVRHGSASERWNQSDVREMYARIVEREKERWLTEIVPDMRKLIATIAAGSAPPSAVTDPALLLKSDPDEFEKAIRAMSRKP
jgi:predicted HTH transcriptional regulator